MYSRRYVEEEERRGFSEREISKKKKKKAIHESNRIALIGRYLKTLSGQGNAFTCGKGLRDFTVY